MAATGLRMKIPERSIRIVSSAVMGFSHLRQLRAIKRATERPATT